MRAGGLSEYFRFAAMGTILALAACSFAPAYKTPRSEPPTAVYKEAGDWKTAEPADSQARGAWWEIFQDPTLDGLEAQVADANQDLKAAYARLLQARAATRIARADLFPTLNVGASATRSRSSVNSPTFPKGAEPVGNNFDLEADRPTRSTSGAVCATPWPPRAPANKRARPISRRSI